MAHGAYNEKEPHHTFLMLARFGVVIFFWSRSAEARKMGLAGLEGSF